MKLMNWLAMLIGTVALGFIAAPAQAAPADGLHAFKAPAAARTADLQNVYWYRRHHHYRYYYGPRYRYYYGPRYYRHHHRHWHHRYW
jgi:hypothetical protein